MIIKKFINGKPVDVKTSQSQNQQTPPENTDHASQQTTNNIQSPTPRLANNSFVPRKSGGCGCGRNR